MHFPQLQFYRTVSTNDKRKKILQYILTLEALGLLKMLGGITIKL